MTKSFSTEKRPRSAFARYLDGRAWDGWQEETSLLFPSALGVRSLDHSILVTEQDRVCWCRTHRIVSISLDLRAVKYHQLDCDSGKDVQCS